MSVPTPVATQLPQHPSVVDAPLPTERTKRRRRSIPVQLVRFASLNLRMAMLALRGHR